MSAALERELHSFPRMSESDAEVVAYLRSEARRHSTITLIGALVLFFVGICALLLVTHLGGPQREVLAGCLALWVFGAAIVRRGARVSAER